MNLKGLLRFAMEATKAEDAPYESQMREMDPERRQFLEDALKAMTVDVAQELGKAVLVIMGEDEHDDMSQTEDVLLNAVEVITDYIQEIDSANDFFKVGGFCVLEKGLSSTHASVRGATAQLIRDLAQNNPFCQEKLLEHKMLEKLMKTLSEDENEAVCCEAMSAISGLVRSYDPALDAFMAMGGFECILGSICSQSDNSRAKLQTRGIFLLSTIIVDRPEAIDKLIALDAIEKLLAMLEKPVDMETPTVMSRLEHVLRTLNTFSHTESGKLRIRQAATLNVEEKLYDIVNELSPRGCKYYEILDFCKEMMITCFSNNSPIKETADR